MTWAARSMTYGEIGEILEISARTAAAHIENAKRKLGVRKLHEAILILAGKVWLFQPVERLTDRFVPGSPFMVAR